ncbi:MAG: squalene/phytoene synthase family protein [Alphaproteobacteria bacterium]|nr:squalene/phytoene synthase family protein [Alphaproteobacteria bacterium]
MRADWTACAEQVQRADPDRFLSAMTARPDQRGPLMVLYAFNLEVARAPWATKEPLIAEMRLQWWRDAIAEVFDGREARRHDVVTPLAEVIHSHKLPRELFDVMIEARSWDIYPEKHQSAAALDDYVQATQGNLLCLTCLALNRPIPDAQRQALEDFGYGAGVATLFKAVPAYKAVGHAALFDETDAGIAALAKRALAASTKARTALRPLAKTAAPALRAGWQSGAVLRQAIKNPDRVRCGELEPSPAAKKLSLLWKSAIGGF